MIVRGDGSVAIGPDKYIRRGRVPKPFGRWQVEGKLLADFIRRHLSGGIHNAAFAGLTWIGAGGPAPQQGGMGGASFGPVRVA